MSYFVNKKQIQRSQIIVKLEKKYILFFNLYNVFLDFYNNNFSSLNTCKNIYFYGIFQVLDQYHEYEVKLIKDADDDNYKNICDIECGSDICTNDVKAICEKYAKKFLSLPKPDSPEKNFRTGYAKYLNYLFNQELRVIKGESDRNEYYKKFKNKCSSDIKLNTLKDHISYIKDEEYNKLKILHELYDNFRNIKIKTTDNSQAEVSNSPKYDEHCVSTYNKGITLYKGEEDKKDKDFYYALKEFSVLYEKYRYRENLIDKKELKVLPYFQDIDDSKEKSGIQKEIQLNNSTISNIYNSFSNHTLDNTQCAKYCHEIISPDENNDEIKSLCVKLVTLLKKLNTIDGVGNNHRDRCSNLIYWTYDQIMHIFGSAENYYKNSSIIHEINKVISRVNDELKVNENCYFYVDGDFDQWNKERDLHYYFLIFDNLSSVKDDVAKIETYCDYLKYINGLYKEHIKSCCTRYIRPDEYMKNKCPSYFKCDKKYYPTDLMTKFKCADNEYKESVEDIFNSITVDLNVIRYSIFMNSFNQIINITNDPFYLFVLAAFGLLGFFFIFFIFYKVTRHTIYIYAHIFYVNYIIRFLKTFRIMKYIYYKFLLHFCTCQFAPIGSSNRKRISRRNMDMTDTSNYHRQESISYNKKNANANPKRKRVQIAYQAT
ncbi:variable surface protein Vir12/24-related [Plasmodium vivax]|uniref:Variable surface protein Vir12/24-related n=1 Tax=Plasmodium vivax (strain Salvador I) TaxID=126793 RepID=A5KCT3_PLAVS|nr:variable surface protein Vir12/24-related [Plasmodium vivax]EDL42840.1 variable surface protein Vir12/24-related [Plasmodium vivax]|eukprot:XP_001608568.1 variable surface protein Vir12/24-related [Plasmodium vivax Sal-1]